jgi:sphinganine-1-phosphate aldolase
VRYILYISPGALIAGTWAAMQYIGSKCVHFLASILAYRTTRSGYLESCRSIVTCTRTIANAITNSIPELYVLGSPPASVIAFASKDPAMNVLEVGDEMFKRGWHLNALNNPAAVHIACTVSIGITRLHAVFLIHHCLTEINGSRC